MIIVSACLAGINCRYDGNDNLIPEIREMVINGEAIALCPEEMGGLSTPRIPCEIVRSEGKVTVMNQNQEDCTAAFQDGAKKLAQIAKILECKTAILKANSPSCGYGMIYDGTFTGNKIPGKGLTAELLEKNGVQIKNESNFKE
jgi:uncharacterized protein YbbK (DUF523 family)